MHRESWEEWFLKQAESISTRSKDPSTKVGAVIASRNNRILSVGYNGFPRGVKDTQERLDNRDMRIKLTIHAEENAILFANKDSLEGSTLYVWPFMTCSHCAGLACQVGIARVVAPHSDNPRWKDDFEIAKIVLKERGIQLDLV